MAAKDYKHASPRAPKAKPPAPLGSWVSFVTGLGLGLVVALAVYMWNAKSAAPPAPSTPVVAEAEARVEAPRVNEPPVVEGTESVEGGDTAEANLEPPRPKFDFYKILPEMEVPVQDWEKEEKEQKTEKPEQSADKNAEGDPSAVKEKPASVAEKGAYVLQIGSYKGFEEADQAKARLAMQGIAANIQRVVINGHDVWFRVHVGPVSNPNELRAMRLKLQEHKTDFIVLKIGGAGTT
jgi:cell division protein FtsN